MSDKLFTQDFTSWRDMQISSAAQRVKALKLADITEDRIDKIINDYVNDPSYEVPTLQPENKKGKRINDHNLMIMIPFKGSANLFYLCPTSSVIIPHSFQVGQNTLAISMSDNATLESDLGSILRDVQTNLDGLTRNFSDMRIELSATIKREAAALKSRLQAIADRDRGRSFPIE